MNLIESFVDGFLNERRRDLLPALFTSGFVDHDPLDIPGVLQPSKGRGGSLHDLKNLADLLDQPTVDFSFTLEDSFSNQSDRIGYRLFGEGTMAVEPVAQAPPEKASSIRKLSVAGTRLVLAGLSTDNGKLISGRVHVTYQVVGIFRVEGDLLAERWGRARVG